MIRPVADTIPDEPNLQHPQPKMGVIASPAPAVVAEKVGILVAIRDAQQFLDNAKATSPELYNAVVGKALIASKSVYGSAVAAGLAWLATRYGFSLTPDMSASISGGVVLVVSAVLRYITSAPITGIIKKGS